VTDGLTDQKLVASKIATCEAVSSMKIRAVIRKRNRLELPEINLAKT
jgi:hypothetical protein